MFVLPEIQSLSGFEVQKGVNMIAKGNQQENQQDNQQENQQGPLQGGGIEDQPQEGEQLEGLQEEEDREL